MANSDSSRTSGFGSYVSECIDELKKVTKPTFAEAKQATLVTVVLVIVVAIIISLLDLAFAQLMKLIIL